MKKSQLCYFGVLAWLALLVLVIVIWVLQIDDKNSRLGPFLIGTLPLLFIIRGILHERLKAYQATVFIALLYLIHGSAELFEKVTLVAIGEVIAALGLMFSAAFYAKWKVQQE